MQVWLGHTLRAPKSYRVGDALPKPHPLHFNTPSLNNKSAQISQEGEQALNLGFSCLLQLTLGFCSDRFTDT